MKRRFWCCFKKILFAIALAGVVQARSQSLWKPELSRSMVADKRANAIGDIITIVIQENNSASKDNSTATSKKSSIDAAVEAFLYSPGASKMLTHNGQLPAMKMAGNQDFAGSGKISNNEKVTARIAARVVDVLPNQNLVIEGTRQIAFSGENQDAVLRGVIRREGIPRGN